MRFATWEAEGTVHAGAGRITTAGLDGHAVQHDALELNKYGARTLTPPNKPGTC
jgi:hypothetical protein